MNGDASQEFKMGSAVDSKVARYTYGYCYSYAGNEA